MGFPGMMGSVSEEIEGYENNLELELSRNTATSLVCLSLWRPRGVSTCAIVDVQASRRRRRVFELTLTDA